MAKYLTQFEGLYVHNRMSAVIRHSSLQRYRGDERGYSLSPPILPLTLPLNFFLCLSLCLSNSPVVGTLLSLFSLSVSLFQPQHCGTQDPLQGQGCYSVCGKAKSSLHISCLSCLKLAAGCPYLCRPGFLWDGEEREECTERRRIKVCVKSISPPVICHLSLGQNSSYFILPYFPFSSSRLA